MTLTEGTVTELSGRRSAPARRGAHDEAVLPLPVGTVTFLPTDIEGSTKAWQAAGEAMGAAVARHYELLDHAVVSNGGVRPVEQGEGDSMVAAFSRASDAVAAALAAQQALAAEAWPGRLTLAVRMAVHTDEAQTRDDRFYAGLGISKKL